VSERCSYCGQLGHWRPDCPDIANLVAKARSVVYIDMLNEPLVARTRKLKARWRVEEQPDIEAYTSIQPMKQVRVNKQQLLAILRDNREEHRGVFLKAQVAFREVAIKALDAQLTAARKGKPFQFTQFIGLRAPEDHTADYDRSIQMLQMSVDDIIVIDDREFQNYVQDVWQWSQEWASNSLRYVSAKNSNARTYGKLSALANG
jgi:hypothetical protein